MSALIELREVHKAYRRGAQRVPVLSGLSLDVAEGEFLALMGPSGSGKSTLLNLIAGIDQIDSGLLSVGGVELATLSERRLADWRAAHVGFIFQFYNLMPVLDAFRQRWPDVEVDLVSGIDSKDTPKPYVSPVLGAQGPVPPAAPANGAPKEAANGAPEGKERKTVRSRPSISTTSKYQRLIGAAVHQPSSTIHSSRICTTSTSFSVCVTPRFMARFRALENLV